MVLSLLVLNGAPFIPLTLRSSMPIILIDFMDLVFLGLTVATKLFALDLGLSIFVFALINLRSSFAADKKFFDMLSINLFLNLSTGKLLFGYLELLFRSAAD
jgi:flagellar biosynthesis protein FliR